MAAFIKFRIYIEENSVYTIPKDISKSGKISLAIYQNNNNVVSQGTYYFSGFVSFDAQPDANYTIHFVNDGVKKMI